MYWQVLLAGPQQNSGTKHTWKIAQNIHQTDVEFHSTASEDGGHEAPENGQRENSTEMGSIEKHPALLRPGGVGRDHKPQGSWRCQQVHVEGGHSPVDAKSDYHAAPYIPVICRRRRQ